MQRILVFLLAFASLVALMPDLVTYGNRDLEGKILEIRQLCAEF